MDFFGLGAGEILLVLVVALIIFGPGKLPGIARNIGKTMNSFKKSAFDITDAVTKELDAEEQAKKDATAAVSASKETKAAGSVMAKNSLPPPVPMKPVEPGTITSGEVTAQSNGESSGMK